MTYERLSLTLNNILNNIPCNAIQVFLSILYKVCFHAMLVHCLLSPSPPTPQRTQIQAHTHILCEPHAISNVIAGVKLCYIHFNVGSVFIS